MSYKRARIKRSAAAHCNNRYIRRLTLCYTVSDHAVSSADPLETYRDSGRRDFGARGLYHRRCRQYHNCLVSLARSHRGSTCMRSPSKRPGQQNSQNASTASLQACINTYFKIIPSEFGPLNPYSEHGTRTSSTFQTRSNICLDSVEG